ncbi:MAG: IS30 family transposase [Spirochaetes bacterium]|nr:IS30 family transposase [Spirochaetota bacterium]
MSYRRMTLSERMNIFQMRYVKNLNCSKIALRLNRSVSTITRELLRGQDNGYYNPFIAECEHLKQRSYQCPKLKIDNNTWQLIKPKLELRWSPEQIAKWLKNDYPADSMSGKTIYNYIHFHMRGGLKKLALKDLRRRGKKRKAPNINEKRGKIKDMTLIDQRPPEINSRSVPGHWEGDLLIGKDHKSAICVIIERQTRFIQLDLLLQYDAKTVRKTIEKRFKRIEPQLRKSITLDQGKENSEHKLLAENLKIDVYFCHPASPWEKGTCENTNGLIRDMLYGIDDFRTLNQYQVGRVARLLNERPRKTLGFKTPKETIANLR